MKLLIYRNNRNPRKYLEIHNDGHRHNSVRQFILTYNLHTPQYTGDKKLHRWRKENLEELLQDYTLTKETNYNNKQRKEMFKIINSLNKKTIIIS